MSFVVFNHKVRVIGAKEEEEKHSTSFAESSEKEKEEAFDLPLQSILKKEK